MFFAKKLYFFVRHHAPLKLFLFVVCLLSMVLSCDNHDDNSPYSYTFPALSTGQLMDLKKSSESMEGFFMTTDMSDFDNSWANRGFYLYICIRFLNHEGINNKLKKSAIPLLIQISNEKDKPMAEAILLLHPKTDGVFYHVERRYFNFLSTSIQIGKTKYLIHDVRINKQGKVTNISLVEESADLEELKQLLFEYGEDIYTDYASYSESTNEGENPFVETQGFAKLHGSSCGSWSFINYHHNTTTPAYLKMESSQSAKAKDSSSDADNTQEQPTENSKDESGDDGTQTATFSSELPDAEEKEAETKVEEKETKTVKQTQETSTESSVPEAQPSTPVKTVKQTQETPTEPSVPEAQPSTPVKDNE